jgi:hypothetical protein
MVPYRRRETPVAAPARLTDRRIVVALAVAVFATHFALWIASWALTGSTTAAWARLYYVARGVEGVVLFVAVLWFARFCVRGPTARALFLVCVVGAVMEALTVTCGSVFYLGGGKVGTGYLLCENVQTWTPWMLLTCALVLMGVSWSLSERSG